MESRPAKSDVVSTIVAVMGHTFLWCAFFLGLLLLAPRAERTIRDFNMRVPELTVGVLQASRWMEQYYYLLPVVVIPPLVLDIAVYWLCRRTIGSRVLSILWSLIMFMIPLASIGFLVLGLMLPGARVWQGLLK